MTNEIIIAITSAIAGGIVTLLATLLLDRRKEKREDRLEAKKLQREVFQTRPEMQIVDFKDYISRTGYGVKPKNDIELFIAHIENIAVEGKKKRSIVYAHYKDKYPIVITRDLNIAKDWVRDHCQGTTRYGLLASSGALRLKPEGIFVKNEISVANWFLNGKDDVRSSYMLEDVVSEFDIQGLELDYSVVAWDADYRYVDGEWPYNNFVGNRWTNVSSEERRLYLKNAYRVLLTRARQGMAIFVPKGSDKDQTRKREWYDGIYEYLKEIEIDIV